MAEDLDTPGRRLFPEYPSLPGMYTREAGGLTGAQLDRARPEKSWGKWSIRRQVSHMACVNYRWFLGNWGQILFGGKLPRDPSLLDTGGADRMMDPRRFHDLPGLLAALQDGCDLAWEILGRETLGSLRGKVYSRRFPPVVQPWPSGDSPRAWLENTMLKAHPRGVWIDAKDPALVRYDLECTFRHVLWEGYAHLRTIQAHKREEGLKIEVPLDPGVGYLRVLRWE
ncbi:MAG: hypothetical protein HYR52_06295 [Candidatus Tectomicrobia bacterium]|nr:hypothetical protein [Candidatus Tectomicrobia bacterium]